MLWVYIFNTFSSGIEFSRHDLFGGDIGELLSNDAHIELQYTMFEELNNARKVDEVRKTICE